MGLGEKYLASARAGAVKLHGEPVDTAFGSRTGSMASALGDRLMGQEGMAPRDAIHRRDAKDSKLPLNFLLAITPTAIHVYGYKLFWGRTTLKKKIGELDRRGMHVRVGRGTIQSFALLTADGSQSMAFEMLRMGKKYGAEIDRIAALLQGPPAAGS